MKKHANKYLKAVISRSLCDVLEIPYMTYTVDVADKKRDIYLFPSHDIHGGFVVLTTDWSNYFNTVSQVKFQLFEMSGSTFNIPVSFSVITGILNVEPDISNNWNFTCDTVLK